MDSSLSNPAGSCFAVTPSDTVPLAQECRALYIGVTGNVAIKPLGPKVIGVSTGPGTAIAVTFLACPAGSILPVRCTHVMATNTTATDIVALY